uniref:Vitellinogen beta-sheet shell domain-containing protein n=1 Tax=Sinocyclocheilus rhinocerous TaxID=307959 RepID=A0A673K626_9TELE
MRLCSSVVFTRKVWPELALRSTARFPAVPTTVINLHREILNIFQLNLKKTQNIYEVQEDGVQGICETQYLISEDEGNNLTTITKSRDLTLCHERIMKDVGLTYTEKCIECQQSRFLGDLVPPVVSIIVRAVRVDHKLLGYQLTAYLDRSTSRVQIIVVSIAVKDNWKMCADGVLLSKHNVGDLSRIAWGTECQKYAITTNAEAGNQGPSPMSYLKVKCENLPPVITTYANVAEYIPGAAQMTGLAISTENNIERQIELIILVPTERTLDIIIKTPTLSSNLMIENDVTNIIRNLYIETSSG